MSSFEPRQDLRQAIQFAMQNLKYWKLDEHVHQFYETWLQKLETGNEPCEHLLAPQLDEQPRSSKQQLRYRAFLDHELDRHVKEGRIPEHLVANLKDENRRIQAELETELFQDKSLENDAQIQRAEAKSDDRKTDEKEAGCENEASSSTSITAKVLEAVLDPRSLQYLMMLGSSMLVLGLVIWLATQGFFDNPLVIAICGAVANLTILAIGAYLLQSTRFENAGRGITLLACLMMPLHLWFYDAQGLIVLDDGGHLWIPALAIACLYFVCAILIRDTLFVYAMVGGIALTGLMILGDQSIARFWEGAAVCSLLIAIGATAIHAERAFAPGEGPFHRQQFGRAFFNAGHCVLLCGFIVLCGWTICSWTYGGILSDVWSFWRNESLPFEQPSLVTSNQLKVLALCLSLVVSYLYGYSYFAVTRRPVLLAGGFIAFLWGEVMFIDAIPVSVTQEIVLLFMAVTAIFLQAFAWSLNKLELTDQPERVSIKLPIAVHTLACLFLLAALGLGLLGYVGTSYHTVLADPITSLYAFGMAVSVLACCLGFSLMQDRQVSLSIAYLIGSCIAFLFLTFGALSLVNLAAWDVAGPVAMIVPLGYLIIATRFSGQSRTAIQIAAQCGTALLTVAVMVSAYGISMRRIEPLTGFASEVMLSVFMFEVCLFYVVYSITSSRTFGSLMALLAGSAAVVQFEHYLGTSYELGLFTFGVIGLAVVFVDRLFRRGDIEADDERRPFDISGQILLSSAGTGSVLLALNRLLMVGFHGGTLILLLAMLATSLFAALLTLPRVVSRWYVALAVLQGCAGLLLVSFGLNLEPWQKLEILMTALGLLLLILSHVGWAQEKDHRNVWVTLGLVFGSALFVIPMLMGLIGQRFNLYNETTPWRIVHEISVLAAGLTLLGTGILFRLRSTTIVGATATLLYIATLVVYIRLPEQLQGVAVYMMIGGGVFFAVSLLLSIFRDIILAMPERFRGRRGLFRILTWR